MVQPRGFAGSEGERTHALYLHNGVLLPNSNRCTSERFVSMHITVLSFEIKIRMDLWGSSFCGFVRWASLWVLQALENFPAWQAPPCPWIICYCWPQFIDIVKESPWYVVFGEAAWMFDQGAGTFIIPYQNILLRNVYKREVWHPEIKMGLYSYDTNYDTSNSETGWTNAHKSCVGKLSQFEPTLATGFFQLGNFPSSAGHFK